jgi:hypothetical protein
MKKYEEEPKAKVVRETDVKNGGWGYAGHSISQLFNFLLFTAAFGSVSYF